MTGRRFAAATGAVFVGSVLSLAPAGALDFKSIAGFDHIATAVVNWNLETGAFNLPNPFVATREGTDISGDRATGNSRQKVLHAEGHVVVHQTEPLRSSPKAIALTQQPSTLTCDRLDVDGTTKNYVATGNVHFTQVGREATADRGTLDDANHHLHLEGHVHIRDNERTLDGDVVDYDTLSGELSAKGNVTIGAPIETAAPGTAPSPSAKPKKH